MSGIYSIEKARNILKEELRDYKGDRITLPYNQELLRQIFFDKDEKGYFLTPDLAEILSKINFRNVSFDNVNISNIDYSDLSGVCINLEKSATPDMSNSNFKGVTFNGDNDGEIIITNSSFEGSQGMVVDPKRVIKKQIRNGSYHDLTNVNFSGVMFKKSLVECAITGSLFKKSERALVVPQQMYDDFSYVNFADAEFQEDLYYNTIVGASFEGSRGVKITSQSIKKNAQGKYDLTKVNFADVIFEVVLDENYLIDGTSFKNSKGAVINFASMPVGNYENCDFTNLRFEGNIDFVEDPKIRRAVGEQDDFTEKFRRKIKTLKNN